MTIKDFIDFIKLNRDLNQSIELNKTIVVFDGHLLQRRLNYFSNQSKEENKFCDYTSYAETIKSFLRRLKICQIVPIVVFDGSIDPNRYKRGFNDRIIEIHEILRKGYDNKSAESPTLRNYVFTSVVRSFGVEIIQTCSDTWKQVAILANKFMCPVYSRRKEFYFLTLEYGLLDDDSILRSRLHFNVEKKYWFLSSKIFRLNSQIEEMQKTNPKLRELTKKFKNNGNDSVIKKYLNEWDVENESLKMLAKGDTEVVLPNWFVNEYQKGIIRPALMNVVKMKTHIVFPQIEDFSQPSSYECTLKLRRFLYGILRTEVDNPSPIKVWDRTTECVSLKEVFVSPLLRISVSEEVPYLGNVRHLAISDRRKLFLKVMETNEAFINRCKITLLLFDLFEEIAAIDGTTFLIIIIRYLIRNEPQIDWKPSIGALILSIMFYGSPILKTDLKWINLSRIAPEDRFKPQYIQFYAQIQACLHISNFINTILEMPFEEGKSYFCLNGIFFYNATKNLSTDEEYESFLRYLFRTSSSMADTFSKITELIESDLNV